MFDALLQALGPVFDALEGLDLTDRAVAEATLTERCAHATDALTAALLDAHQAGTLTPKQAGPSIAFGRPFKPSEATRGFSVDAVDIAGAGAGHAHPDGEVSWCVPLEGEPVFEGARAGWVVLPPGSRHVPEVTGGRMLIVYFLPGGSIDWKG